MQESYFQRSVSFVQSQAVSIVIIRAYWGAAYRTESAKQVQELLMRHLAAAVE
jgi:hypothetical protein